MKYYIEVNTICILILFLFYHQVRVRDGVIPTGQRLFQWLILATVILCFSDMIAGVYRGQQYFGSRAIIEISNELYFEMIAIISYLWSCFVFARVAQDKKRNKVWSFLWAIPLIGFTVMLLSNVKTGFFFRIDAQNLYQRGDWVWVHWVVTWTYFLIPTYFTFVEYLREKSKYKKDALLPYLRFAIAPFIASTIQMLFYGITATQVGITISIVMIALAIQNSRVLSDGLTGLNNRRGLDTYISSELSQGKDVMYQAYMIDVNNFKKINDQYGHIQGDKALQVITEALKNSCQESSSRMFLCRYGGDEFLLIAKNQSEDEIQKIKDLIHSSINTILHNMNTPFTLEVSIGVAHKVCNDENDVTTLINEADMQMYKEKKEPINR